MCSICLQDSPRVLQTKASNSIQQYSHLAIELIKAYNTFAIDCFFFLFFLFFLLCHIPYEYFSRLDPLRLFFNGLILSLNFLWRGSFNTRNRRQFQVCQPQKSSHSGLARLSTRVEHGLSVHTESNVLWLQKTFCEFITWQYWERGTEWEDERA